MTSRLPAQDPLRAGDARSRAVWMPDALWKKLASVATDLGYRSTNALIIDLLIHGVREQEAPADETVRPR